MTVPPDTLKQLSFYIKLLSLYGKGYASVDKGELPHKIDVISTTHQKMEPFCNRTVSTLGH